MKKNGISQTREEGQQKGGGTMFRTVFGLVMAVAVVMCFSTAEGFASDKDSVWIEGGATLKGKPSAAIGYRWNSFGIKVGGAADNDYNNSDFFIYRKASYISVDKTWDISSDLRIKDLYDKKVTSYTIGFDLMYFYDFTEKLSGYIEGGVYRHEIMEDIYTPLSDTPVYKPSYPNNTSYVNKGDMIANNVAREHVFAGGVGVHYQVSDMMIVTLGYHSVRGVSAGVGLTW